MSVDWAELSTVQETVARFPKWDKGWGVASITAEVCWHIGEAIEYSPTTTNPAHSDIVGDRSDRVRKQFALRADLKLVD